MCHYPVAQNKLFVWTYNDAEDCAENKRQPHLLGVLCLVLENG